MIRAAADIGGTFTDVIVERDTVLHSTKVLTTHADPAFGVLEGLHRVLGEAHVAARDISVFLHGTTLATNALIERKGAVTGLLTTEGHRDVIEMAYEHRFEQYDVNMRRPEPLVPRHLRLGIPERLDVQGRVLRPLDEARTVAAVRALLDQGVTSICVGFLHAYRNPAHEQRVRELILGVSSDVSITLASEVCPEIREYERLSTACANAYVKPLMDGYLASLERQLFDTGCRAPILLMTSGGGLTTLQAAQQFPVRLVESGPAGGAMLAAGVAEAAAEKAVVAFDMGGTTAKLCLIDDARPQHSRAFEVDRTYRFRRGSGLPVRVPVIEMVEIGAGGGSLASVDVLQRIRVGPASAGSDPGPAAYGRGGQLPAVTDADAVLGMLLPDAFAGGNIPLDIHAAASAIDRHVAAPLEIDLEQAASAIKRVVDENMALAARAHASEWGKRLADRTLIAFGGAAPLHAAAVARTLKVPRVLVPAHAGVGSALGFLLAPVSFEVVRSLPMSGAHYDGMAVLALLEEMREEALTVVEQVAERETLSEVVRAFIRYVGQGYELAVVIDADRITSEDALRSCFESAYQALYGRTLANADIEVLSWTLTLSGPPQGRLSMRRSGCRPEGPADDSYRSRLQIQRVYDVTTEQYADVPVVTRTKFPPGERWSGPLLIVEAQTTTVVPSDFTVWCDAFDNLILESAAGAM